MRPGNIITIYRGAAFGGYSLILFDADGDPVDLTGCVPVIKCRKSPAKPVQFVLETSLGVASGEIQINPMDDEATLDLTIGTFEYDLMIEDSSGNVLGPFFAGKVEVKNPISRAES